jgi:hypothetical protein
LLRWIRMSSMWKLIATVHSSGLNQRTVIPVWIPYHFFFSFVKHLYAWQPKPALTSGLNFTWILQASKSRERIFEGNSHSGLVNREKNHHQVIQLDFVIYKATKFYLRDRQHFWAIICSSW